MNMSPGTFFLMMAYAVGSPFTTIFQRYLTFHVDNLTQNFYRSVCGTGMLLLISCLFFKKDFRTLLADVRAVRRAALTGVLLFFSMVLLISGMARTSAVLAGFFFTLTVPMSIVAAVLFFPQEKDVVKGKYFASGAVMALIGTFGLIFAGSRVSFTFSIGTLFLLLSAVFGTAATVYGKHAVMTANAFCVSALSGLCMTVLFLTGGLLRGTLGEVARVPAITNIIMCFSGVYGVFFGMGLYFVLIKRVGVIIFKFIDITQPVFTGIYGYLIFHETLTLPQGILAILLLCGCGLILSGVHLQNQENAEIA
jgi:drug/metabolite transporter (DMT)-like permease